LEKELITLTVFAPKKNETQYPTTGFLSCSRIQDIKQAKSQKRKEVLLCPIPKSSMVNYAS
jgi:hypothetical protein